MLNLQFRLLDTPLMLLGRLRPVTTADRALSDKLNRQDLGSGSVRTDRDMAGSMIARLDRGEAVSEVLHSLPIHDE
jgi:hypothetical protein